MRHEFATHNTEETLATMVEDAYVNHIPVLTGGVGLAQLREFYSRRFIPQMPPDTEMLPISRTIGENQLVDEMVFKFTHSTRMDWMLPLCLPGIEQWPRAGPQPSFPSAPPLATSNPFACCA